MMAENIYFVRHGESASNVGTISLGETAELTEAGHQQAKILGHRFKSIEIDKIISSPLSRAFNTAEQIGIATTTDVTQSGLFSEVKRPSSMIGLDRNSDDYKIIKQEIDSNYGKPNWRHSDEETFADQLHRAQQALELLAADPGQNVVVVLHGAILKFLVGLMFFNDNLTPDLVQRIYRFLKMSNTGITLCQYRGEKWKLITWNDSAHLGETI